MKYVNVEKSTLQLLRRDKQRNKEYPFQNAVCVFNNAQGEMQFSQTSSRSVLNSRNLFFWSYDGIILSFPIKTINEFLSSFIRILEELCAANNYTKPH